MARKFPAISASYLSQNTGFTGELLTVLETIKTAKTAMAWVKPASLSATGTVIGTGRTSGPSYTALGVTASGVIFSEQNTDSEAPGKVEVGNWYHIAHTVGGTENTDDTAWLNGNKDTTPATLVSNEFMQMFTVGALYLNGSFVSFFNGEIAEVAIWSVTLTEAQIKELAAKKNPTNVEKSKLVGYWRLNENKNPEPSFEGKYGPSLTLGAAIENGTTSPEIEEPVSAKTVEGKAALTGAGAITVKGTRIAFGKSILSATSVLTTKGSVEKPSYAMPVAVNEEVANFQNPATAGIVKIKSPPGTKVGDMIICSVNVFTAFTEVKKLEGWTQRGESVANEGGYFMFFTRIATVAGEHEYPFEIGAEKQLLWWASRIEGVSSILVAATSGNSGSKTVKWASATPTGKPTMDFVMVATNEVETYTVPAGFTRATIPTEGPRALAAYFWRELTTEAATGETTAEQSTLDGNGTLRLILRGEEEPKNITLLEPGIRRAYTSPSTTLSLTAPSRQSTDGLLVALWIESTSITPSTPTGWTLLGKAGDGVGLTVFWFGRKCDGTSTDNFSSTFSSTGSLGELFRITGGGGPASPTEWTVGTTAHGESKTAKAPSLSVTKGSLAILCLDTGNQATIEKTTTGWTTLGQNASAVAYPTFKLMTATESVEPEVSFTASHNWTAMLLGVLLPGEHKTVEGQVSLSAASAITIKGVRVKVTKAILSATSSQLIVGRRIAVGKIALTASSSITVTNLRRTRLGKASQTAIGVLTVSGVKIPTTKVALSAISAITVKGTRVKTTKANLSAIATLTASAEGTHIVQGKVNLTASATISVAGTPIHITKASLAAASLLTVKGVRQASTKAPLSASAVLKAKGLRISSGKAILSSQSAMTVLGIRVSFGRAPLAAASTLHSAGIKIIPGKITLQAISILHAAGFVEEILEHHADARVTLTINDAYRVTSTLVKNSSYTVEEESPYYVVWEKGESHLGLDLYHGAVTLNLENTVESKQSGGIEVAFSHYDDLVEASI